MPSAILPVSSKPSMWAPCSLAMRRASRAERAVEPYFTRWRSMAWRTSPSMSEESFDAEPSTPIPTFMPRASISWTRQMPDPSRMLDEGQWATPAPSLASVSSSASWKKMPWAYQTSSPMKPVSSMSASGRRLNIDMQKSSSSAVSAR